MWSEESMTSKVFAAAVTMSQGAFAANIHNNYNILWPKHLMSLKACVKRARTKMFSEVSQD